MGQGWVAEADDLPEERPGAQRRLEEAGGLEGGLGPRGQGQDFDLQVATFSGGIKGPCPHSWFQAGPSPKLKYAATVTMGACPKPVHALDEQLCH